MDFTLKTYSRLLEAFQRAGYGFLTFQEFMKASCQTGKTIVLRHDVDELAGNALKMAALEKRMGIKATYFFRIVKQSNNPEVIKSIAEMGHEVGYHYEDLATNNGDVAEAFKSFEQNLAYFRTFYPVETVCMHGSSTSKFDNRELWKHKPLSAYGLIGEPYLTVDFEKTFYLTDTGYSWDGGKFAVRDVVPNTFGLSFKSTNQIIDAVDRGEFPAQSLILSHTLWTSSTTQWFWLHVREFLRNRIKFAAKENKFLAFLYSKLVSLYWKR